MSHAMAPSVMCSYGVIQVCQEWGLSRATLYHQRSQIARSLFTPAKRGRQPPIQMRSSRARSGRSSRPRRFSGKGTARSGYASRGRTFEPPRPTSSASCDRLVSWPRVAPRGTGGRRFRTETITTGRPNHQSNVEHRKRKRRMALIRDDVLALFYCG